MQQKDRNFTGFGLNMNPVVSITSGLFILLFSLYALFRLEQVSELFESINDFVISNFDWVFIFSSNAFIVVGIGLALSKLGLVKIGGLDSEPEFSNFAWYSMLISAGMGIGLMFWAVGEPLTHYVVEPPIFAGSDSAVAAMASTFLHWGLHPWGIYAMVALGLAYFAFNKKLPLSFRSLFYPFFGERIHGVLGDFADIFAVLATMFGLATSLGLGTMQINSGLDYMFGTGTNVGIQVGIIAGVTLLALVSVMAGINKGVRFLSEINIKLAFVFMLLVFLLGPTVYILRLFISSTGFYFGRLAEYAAFLSLNGDSDWQGEWTIFYLAWWISWSPFVGMFIARISKGRTIREFMLAVLLLPTLVSFFWLSVFGGTAIQLDGVFGGALFETVQANYSIALFEMVDLLHIPLLPGLVRVLLFIVITALVMSFFITSSDSGSLVVDKLTSGGVMHSPRHQRAFWAVLEGLLAATLLVIGGEVALFTLQTAVITAGLPLAIMLVVMSVALVKDIIQTHSKQDTITRKKKFRELLAEFEGPAS
ncbi:MAG: BCCT family transporter [Spirochaetaceae bacterium]|nr:MAG: BCCT family transporter [Spirochaetaceae bacterium]